MIPQRNDDMIKKLSLKLAIYIMIILVLIVGGISLLYATNSKELYIQSQEKLMSSVVKELNNIDFKNQTDSINVFLDKYYKQTYELYICDDEITPIFSTKRMLDANDIVKNVFIDKIDEFSEENLPVLQIDETGRHEQITLRTKVDNFGSTYYVYIEESLKTSDAVFAHTNRYFVMMVVGFIVLSGVLVFLLINSTTKSLRELSDVANKLSEGDYSVRYSGKITNDEVGVLAKNLNFMADTIAENVNNLNNYNFLLKEDNSRMSEYENMRKRVLTNVTHELKTPLAIISSQIEMMTVTKSDEKKKYYYQSAMDEIDKMSKLISKLLNFSAGEKGIFENECEEIDLKEFIEKLCKNSEIFLKSKKLKFEKDINSAKVVIPKEHIEHIFNNYIMNAVQYSSQNSKIFVGVKPLKNCVRLSVFNEGSFVKEEDGEKIWTDFYKTNSTGANDTNRVGIGLFIVKEISLINHDKCGFINRDNGVEFWYDFCEYDY